MSRFLGQATLAATPSRHSLGVAVRREDGTLGLLWRFSRSAGGIYFVHEFEGGEQHISWHTDGVVSH